MEHPETPTKDGSNQVIQITDGRVAAKRRKYTPMRREHHNAGVVVRHEGLQQFQMPARVIAWSFVFGALGALIAGAGIVYFALSQKPVGELASYDLEQKHAVDRMNKAIASHRPCPVAFTGSAVSSVDDVVEIQTNSVGGSFVVTRSRQALGIGPMAIAESVAIAKQILEKARQSCGDTTHPEPELPSMTSPRKAKLALT